MFATSAKSRRTRLIDLGHDDVTNELLINGIARTDTKAGNWDIFTAGGNPPKPGDFEIWKIANSHGGWHHPLHIHLVDFQILSRKGGTGKVAAWEKGPK